MRGSRQHINPQFFHIQFNMSNCLHSVGMKKSIMSVGNLAQFLDWLNCSQFIVRKHDRNQLSLIGNHFSENLRSYRSCFVWPQIYNGIAKSLNRFTRMENRMMLKRRSDNRFVILICKYCAFYCPVIAFCSTGGKVDFFWQRMNTFGYCFSGGFKRLSRFTRKSIRLGGVPILIQKPWLHCFKCVTIQFCRCRIICIDMLCHGYHLKICTEYPEFLSCLEC